MNIDTVKIYGSKKMLNLFVGRDGQAFILLTAWTTERNIRASTTPASMASQERNIIMKMLITVLASLFVVSCASRPASITPVAISASDYTSLSCQQTIATLSSKRDEENELSRQQSRAATGDAIGVFLLLLPVSSIFGGDVEGELAQAKGEVVALERAVGLNCEQNGD